MPPYNADQINILVILNILASTFSFLGATFIITNFFVFEEFRANFAFKLILFVAFGDILNSLGNFMGSPADGSALCILQALLTQFGDIVSFSWVTAIAAVIYNVIRREVPPTREDVERWYKKIHLIIWPTTISLSILPFFTGNYGFDNALCWITFEPKPYGELWRWICFYIPLWASIAFVSIMYYRVWGQLTAPEIQRKDSGPPKASANTAHTHKTDHNDEEKAPVQAQAQAQAQAQPHAAQPSISDVFDPDIAPKRKYSSNTDVVAGGYQASATDMGNMDAQQSDENKTPKSGGGTLQRIKFYPFVLFGCYLFATIRRIAEWASEDHVAPFGVAACQVFTSALLGTCNAILYGFTPVVRAKDSEWIREKCCASGVKGDEDGVTDDGIADSGNDNADTGNESIR
jgi:hypothetical protein